MARLRYNGLVATLGGSLTSGATSVTFAAALTHSGGTNVPTIAGSDYIPLTILDSNGVPKEVVYLTAYTAAATTGTIARGKEGTTGSAHSSAAKVVASPTVYDLPGGGGIIAAKSYNPNPFVSYSTGSATAADVDATNMAVTFVAPASGSVSVVLNALARSLNNSSDYFWSLRSGSTDVAGTDTQVLNTSTMVNANGANFRIGATIHVTGLTPGTSYTYKWAHRVATSGTGSIFVGNNVANAGQATMEVHALP